jgi:hypothetical protein
VSGRVIDALTEGPVEGALVELLGTDGQALSGQDGRFAIAGVTPAVYDLRVRMIGYETYLESNIIVGSGKPLTVVVRLAVQPLELDPLEVQASYFQRSIDAASSTRRLSAADTRRAPGVNEDVVRSVALLPGVGVTSGGRNDLAVRGGAFWSMGSRSRTSTTSVPRGPPADRSR